MHLEHITFPCDYDEHGVLKAEPEYIESFKDINKQAIVSQVDKKQIDQNAIFDVSNKLTEEKQKIKESVRGHLERLTETVCQMKQDLIVYGHQEEDDCSSESQNEGGHGEPDEMGGDGSDHDDHSDDHSIDSDDIEVVGRDEETKTSEISHTSVNSNYRVMKAGAKKTLKDSCSHSADMDEGKAEEVKQHDFRKQKRKNKRSKNTSSESGNFKGDN